MYPKAFQMNLGVRPFDSKQNLVFSSVNHFQSEVMISFTNIGVPSLNRTESNTWVEDNFGKKA